MSQIVNKAGTFALVFMFVFCIEHIFGEKYYEVHDKYPVSVRSLQGPALKTGSKRSAQNDGIIQSGTQFRRGSNDIDENGIKSLENHKRPKHKSCVRCPKLITAVAREGLDGVIMEPPEARSCKTNLPFARHLFQIETLFGPEMPFLLPQGRHSLHARIRDIETGMVVRSCTLKYNVIVPRCDAYPNIQNKNVSMSCTAATIWGSKCAFECKNDGEFLTNRDPMICTKHLEWSGIVPDCSTEIENELSYQQDEPAKVVRIGDENCQQPKPPANGRFKCRTRNDNLKHLMENLGVDSLDSLKTLAPGTVCRAKCNRSYSIPYHLYPLSTIQCANGAWNSTNIEYCYKKVPQRRHLSRRRKNPEQ